MELRERGQLPQSFIDSMGASESAAAESAKKESEWVAYVESIRTPENRINSKGELEDSYGNYMAMLPRAAQKDAWGYIEINAWIQRISLEMSEEGGE